MLEKALSTGDFAKQRAPLEEILRQLKPLRLRSLEELDFNTRGRLLTTLLRVGRQKKPPEPPPTPPPDPSAPSAEVAQPSEKAREPEQPIETAARAPEAQESEAVTSETSISRAEVTAEPVPAQPMEAAPRAAGAEEAASPAATTESSPASAEEPRQSAPAPAQPPSPARPPSPEEEKLAAYRDVMFLVGSVWQAAGDEGRARPAFAASGREPQQREAVKDAAPPAAGDWREEAQGLESAKRARDAAKLHERHSSYADAARLYEASGDLKSALRCFLAAKDQLAARRLLRQLKPEQFLPIVEKVGAYQLLMEHYVEAGEFDNVAKLYERARQFDQAAIAWEKSGKLGPARKAYERANQPANAERVRQLEVARLVERGDRLGAAVLLVGAGKRAEAVQTLSAVPAAKAFRFLQKLKLDDEALALARREIDRAEAENRPGGSARWLEMLGEASAAAEAWIRAERKDRALAIYEQAGEWGRAAPLAESLGQKDKAIELYHRAGDKTSADRVAAMPAPGATAPPSGASVALEREGEEG